MRAHHRPGASGLESPILKALAISVFPVLMIVLATERPGLQRGRAASQPRVWFRSPTAGRSSNATHRPATDFGIERLTELRSLRGIYAVQRFAPS
jgi:hypothetical protein